MQKKLTSNSIQGFTLIETVMVLFIISILMAGQLKGQTLIDTARENKLIADFTNIVTMIHGYQDRFKALPGDDPLAKIHLSTNLSIGNGNGQIDGNWYDTDVNSETQVIWQQLRAAGFLDYSVDVSVSDQRPINAFGHYIGIQTHPSRVEASPIVGASGQAINGSFIICSTGIPGKLVQSLDIKLDDGNPATGSMLATVDHGANYRSGVSAATIATNISTDIKVGEQYIVCMGV